GVGSGAPANEDVGQGLKEALLKGISAGAQSASKHDGFFRNELIHLTLREEFRKVEGTMRKLGLGAEVDKVLMAINRGAESAASEAKPHFINAIRQMTIQDAFSILKGQPDAATMYLKKTTTDQLTTLFQPKV